MPSSGSASSASAKGRSLTKAKPVRETSTAVSPLVDPPTDTAPSDAVAPGALGRRLRARRETLGVSLRQFARDLNLSASFISQLETGKTQPSVATLYAICSALNMSITDVFDTQGEDELVAGPSAAGISDAGPKDRGAAKSTRHETDGGHRSPVVSPAQRRRIMLDSGVTWERLSSATNADFDFVFVRYDVGGSSNADGRLIRHVGTECGYVLRGVLEITLGFETFQMVAGDAISFDSSTPHRLANVGDEPVEAIWFDEGGHNRQA